MSVERFPAFYYEPGFIGSVRGNLIPHLMIPFTVYRYEQFSARWRAEKWTFPTALRNLAKEFNLRDNRWNGLAGCIFTMMEKNVKPTLIQRCILADHLDVWKFFDQTLISRHEWDDVDRRLTELIK